MLALIYACNAGCVYAVATMDKARQKVKLAEICSDLQTAEEDNTGGRSRRKKVYVNYLV
jgi:hypothetical protein